MQVRCGGAWGVILSRDLEISRRNGGQGFPRSDASLTERHQRAQAGVTEEDAAPTPKPPKEDDDFFLAKTRGASHVRFQLFETGRCEQHLPKLQLNAGNLVRIEGGCATVSGYKLLPATVR